MALFFCPLCNQRESQLLHSLSLAPKSHLIGQNQTVSAQDFGSMQIVECISCGHIYNSAFNPDEAESMYVLSHMTNAPVSQGMVNAVKKTADLIMSSCPKAERVLEIGGGSGALALAIASSGIEVVMVEPNRHSDVSLLADKGVELVSDMFPSDKVTGKFDLIVCRQVMEHVPDPSIFMDSIEKSLAAGGSIYLEVPNADFILKNRSIVDFHFPHIQYFRQQVLTEWLEKRGHAISSVISIKDNHDIGFFLSHRQGVPKIEVPPKEGSAPTGLDTSSFAIDLVALRAQAAELLRQSPKPIALYGATAYSQAFFGAWPNCVVERMFDDTEAYWSSSVYGPKGSIRVMRCDKDAIKGVGTVVICAYLHDKEIMKRLRQEGFEGTVYTLRSAASNPVEAGIQSLA
jgi:2-polyprenyl-3-methyl-5-hydroxy-6-metoxy-1,4-benzoquinol methylase